MEWKYIPRDVFCFQYLFFKCIAKSIIIVPFFLKSPLFFYTDSGNTPPIPGRERRSIYQFNRLFLKSLLVRMAGMGVLILSPTCVRTSYSDHSHEQNNKRC